jgi:serine protease
MKKVVLAIATALVLGSLTAPAAKAVESPQSALANAVGLMIKYRPGVSSIAPNGAPTSENFAGTNLSGSHDVGVGYTAVSFDYPLTEGEASAIVAKVSIDPRVAAVEIDHDLSITPQSIAIKNDYLLALALGSVFKPAAAPLSVKVSDSWSSSAPFTPRIRVSWAAPKVLNGGRLSGYQVWQAGPTGTFSLASTISNPKTLSTYLTLGLTAGSVARVYVKAITKLGVALKYGSPSKSLKVTPTTRPTAPEITGYYAASMNEPKWGALSPVQRGGLPVTYQLTAMAPGKTTLSCGTTNTHCALTGFDPDVAYTLSVKATNSRGSSTSSPALRPRDPYYFEQWYLWGEYGVDAPHAWTQLPATYPNEVVVAVIDTGFTSHADLDPQVVPGYDFVSTDQVSNDGDGWDPNASDPGSYNSNPTSTSSWHGTHVAGLIGAAANGIGITGVAPGVKLQSVRALGGNGGKASDLLAAVTWASGGVVAGVPNNPTPAKVINISMGTSTPNSCDSGVAAAFQAALSRGVTIVTSAGNGDSNNNPMLAADSYPGNCLGSINVGATAANGNSSYFSNYGYAVDISAPGGDDRFTEGTQSDAQGMMISTFNTGTRAPGSESYAFDEGTSMAAPLVSGAAALLYAKSSTMTPNLVWQYLQASVKSFAPSTDCALTAGTQNQICGVGILDVAAALRLVK